MKRLRNFQVKRWAQFRRVNVYDQFHTQRRKGDLKVTEIIINSPATRALARSAEAAACGAALGGSGVP